MTTWRFSGSKAFAFVVLLAGLALLAAGPASAAVGRIDDTAPPPAPIVTSLAPGGTAKPNPEFRGTAEPGSQVTLTDGATTLCVITADPSGDWWCIPSITLTVGSHSLVATATDAAGNTGRASEPLGFIVDGTPPPIPKVSSPVNGALVNTEQPVFAGTAEPGALVSVLDDGIEICVAAVDVAGEWTCPASFELPDGRHFLTALAIDPAGNASRESGVLVITIDAAAPANSTINSPGEGAVSNSRPAIRGIGEPDATVVVLEGPVTVCTSLVDPAGNWTCLPSTPLADGTHTLTTRTTDLAGNPELNPAPAVTFSVTDIATIAVELHGVLTDTNADGLADLGDSIGWTMILTNTGNVALGQVTGTDSAGEAPCLLSQLVPAETTKCQGQAAHLVTQDEMDAGFVINTASAAGFTVVGSDAPGLRRAPLTSGVQVNSVAAVVTIRLDSIHAITLTKTGTAVDTNNDGLSDPGDVISWDFLVRNTGNAALTDVSVDDPTAGIVACPASALAAGDSMVCSAPDHSITTVDATAGSVSNTATAIGTGGGTQVRSAPVTAVVLVVAFPAGAGSSGSSAGATVVVVSGVLAATGVPMLAELTVGVLLVLIGCVVLILGRRRPVRMRRWTDVLAR
jgi:uncharacterized repeat protein (TIGR01451 family)